MAPNRTSWLASPVAIPVRRAPAASGQSECCGGNGSVGVLMTTTVAGETVPLLSLSCAAAVRRSGRLGCRTFRDGVRDAREPHEEDGPSGPVSYTHLTLPTKRLV